MPVRDAPSQLSCSGHGQRRLPGMRSLLDPEFTASTCAFSLSRAPDEASWSSWESDGQLLLSGTSTVRGSADGHHGQERVGRRHQLPGRDLYKVRRSIAMLQGGHVLDDLSVGEHRHFLTKGVHGMHPPTSACHRSDLIVQIVHCGPRGLPSNADSVVRLPRVCYGGDNTDLVQASVDAVNKVRPIPGQRELRVSGAQILIRCPGNDPYKLVLLYMRHSHAYRVKSKRQLSLAVTLQLLFNDLNRGISLNHFVSIPYGPEGYHQVSCSPHGLADHSGRT